MRQRGSLTSIGERVNIGIVAQGTDIWYGTATTTPIPNQLSGESISIVSTSANDSLGSTGVNEVVVHYLDSNWLENHIEISLSGTTIINLPVSNIKFINNIHTSIVGSNAVAVGNITIFKTGDPTTVYSIILAGGNMSLNINKMIPGNKKFFLQKWQASASGGNKAVFIRIRSTDFHGTLYDGDNPVFLFKDTCTLEAGGVYSREWGEKERIMIPSKSIIKVSAWALQTGANISCSFEGELVGTE